MNIDRILANLKSERDRLDRAIAALQTSKNGSRPTISRRKRKMSAAGRRRIAAVQKARWAKWRKTKKK